MDTICRNMTFQIIMVNFQMLVTLYNKEMLLPSLSVIPPNLILSKIQLKTPTEPAEFSPNKHLLMFYQKTLKTCQILTTITNKETFFQLVTITIHKAKLISKTMICNQIVNIQSCLVNNNTFYLKMLKIFQILIMITNREMFYQQDTNTILKVKLTFKIMIWHQIANIQLCLANKKTAMFYQKTLKIFQTLIMITNKEMFFQRVTIMIHKAKHISRIMIFNQTVNIQLCSMKKKKRSLINISIIINTVMITLSMIKKFK